MKHHELIRLTVFVLVSLLSGGGFFTSWASTNFRKSRVLPQNKVNDQSYRVISSEGEVLLREGNGSLEKLNAAQKIAGNDSVFHCREKSKLLLARGDGTFRFIGKNTFSCEKSGIVLRRGSMLADWRTPHRLGIEGFDVKLSVVGKSILFVQVTTNGGLKLITLAGRTVVEKLSSSEKKVELLPGELVFAKPLDKGFSDKLNVNLKTLVATSALVHEFPDTSGFRRDLAKAVLEQEVLIRKRYRAVVGDARTPDTFDIRELAPSVDANATKQPD